MLLHYALAINDPEEIQEFYTNVLQFTPERNFTVNSKLSQEIFNIDTAVDVCMVSLAGSQIEIFITSVQEKKVFSHICLAYRNSKAIYNAAVSGGYSAVARNNPGSDTYFIRDKAGNLFEIKEASGDY